MAFDKVIDSATLDADLTSVADAIRAKGGTSDALVFPAGFVSAVEAISAGGGLKFDMGSFTLSEDVSANLFTNPGNAVYGAPIPHNLGEIPDFIMVWTDHWAGLTADDTPPFTTQTMVGFIWLNGLTGMVGRASSAANYLNPVMVELNMTQNDYRISVAYPTSASYGYHNDRLPTAEYFRTYGKNNSTWWRGGVQYNYFVSKAWWNVGGVANAE